MRRWLLGLLTVAPVAAAVLVAAGTVAGGAGAPVHQDGGEATDDVGRELYQRDCAVCHGTAGDGTYRGPDITASGAGGVDFVLSTGRMPIEEPSDPTSRSEPSYSPEEIEAIVSYVEANFVDGPPVPDVDVTGADLSEGGILYRLNCASCHQAAGAGGALAYGTIAPELGEATPVEVVGAMRLGPGRMPVFDDEAFDEAEAAAIAAYVEELDEPRDRGGFDLGHFGPVPEGLVAWVFGLGTMVLVIRWLGVRQRA